MHSTLYVTMVHVIDLSSFTQIYLLLHCTKVYSILSKPLPVLDHLYLERATINWLSIPIFEYILYQYTINFIWRTKININTNNWRLLHYLEIPFNPFIKWINAVITITFLSRSKIYRELLLTNDPDLGLNDLMISVI